MKYFFTLAILGALFLSGCASQPKREVATKPIQKFYHRLYQGYRLDSVDKSQFEEIINRQFLPLFPQAQTHGLYAYRPVLPLTPTDCSLPAEVALLTFESEEAYTKYRETEIGKKIRDAHSLVFNAETSKSLVPEPYEGIVELSRAYSLKNDFNEYRASESALIIHCKPLPKKDIIEKMIERYGRGSDAENIVFAASPTHLVEYVFAKDKVQLERVLSERRERLSSLFQKTTIIKLEKQKIGDSTVEAGLGVDAQW